MSPLKNNVIFASNCYYFAFSLNSFAAQYQQRYPSVNASFLSKVLWGDYYYNHETRKFIKKATKSIKERTFVQFILEPMYKLLAHSVSHEKPQLEKI